MHRVTVLLLCALCSTLEGMCDGAKSAVAFNCASTSSICFISGMVFKNPDDTLTLANIEGKRSLSIKTGEITALRMEHCEGFRTFEKVTIGHTELQELCITSQFVQVMAEGNRIRTLHTDAPTGGQKLEILKLSNNKLSDAGALCQFKALKELHLENNQLSTLDMACFSQMSKLQKLLLAGNRLNHLAITSSTLELPALTTLDLRNNTLTVLDVSSWTFDSLATLQLAFNNLTHVTADMARFVDLQEISLSNNNWHCEPLDALLTALQTNFVKIVDGDSECQGINNSTICCREVVLATEGELFGELAKFTELEQRYSDTNSSLLARLDAIEAEFQAQLDATKQIILKAAEPEHPEPDNEGSGDNEEKQQGETTSNVTETTGSPADGTAGEDAESITKPPTEAAAKEAASKEKKCKPQKPMDAPDVNCTTNLEEIRRELHTLKEEINPLLAKSRTEYQQLSLTTKLIKHEFRTAVHRGALKLKALANQLNELHLYMKSKFDSVK
ncbi:leucine-rich repeat transmembrane neuronal protein 2-like [Anopheles aquasalis]|uniref:leucine-rich repeat transmembrane neuronal protein 2-like n=1 Tax=Anopheles aquasalis TaxID=42839 RepID=UPI00215B4D33|nr:leucine-rich repeat transmembrane neuronal protein 2-like [Anopheles aquasalis]